MYTPINPSPNNPIPGGGEQICTPLPRCHQKKKTLRCSGLRHLSKISLLEPDKVSPDQVGPVLDIALFEDCDVIFHQNKVGYSLNLGAIYKVRTPKNGHFGTPHPPLYSKIRFGLTPNPPLYKRILVTHFQNTMNFKKIQEYQSN